MDTTSYWVDLQGIVFQEDKPDASWLQAFPIGEYKHPLYGKITMTVEKAKAFAQNVIHKVRGIDIAIDYGHDSGGEAAGWVTSAEARGDGLWLFVEWTQEAAAKIRGGQFRYFSPEYVDKWTHPKTGEKFTDVLLGGALTNRPFLKDIMPVNLSEILAEDQDEIPEGGGMEKLLELLKKHGVELGEDADEEAVLEALESALQNSDDDEPEETPEALSEEEIAKILEEHPAMAALVDQNKALSDQNKSLVGRVVNLERTAREASVSAKLTEWHDGGEKKKFGLPVALDDKITSFMLSMNETQAGAFKAILDELVKLGFVPLGETSGVRRRRDTSAETSSIETKVDEGIKKLMSEEDLSYGDASAKFFADNEDLYDEYLRSLDESQDEDEEVES